MEPHDDPEEAIPNSRPESTTPPSLGRLTVTEVVRLASAEADAPAAADRVADAAAEAPAETPRLAEPEAEAETAAELKG